MTINALTSTQMLDLVGQAKRASNTRAEYIAEHKKDEQEKSAALDNSAEIKAAQTQSSQTVESLQKTEQAKTAFNTQQIAQETEDETEQTTAYQTAAKKFQEYMEMTPEERWFEAFLKEQKMTKEEFEALPPEEKEKLLAQFEDYIKNKIAEGEAKKQLKEEEEAIHLT